MDEKESIFGNNSIEDVSWLCSLSESALDMFLSLKMLVIQRVRVIVHDELAENFDLKMLRALGFILMDISQERVKDFSLKPGLAESGSFMDGCNLLKCKLDNIMSIEEIKTFVCFEWSLLFLPAIVWMI
ncbi:hypothetical protein SLE2022_306790 [Rubroshorea leprosula]